MVINWQILKNNDGGCFVNKGRRSTNVEESLPILPKGRIALVTPKKKDKNTTLSCGEERRVPILTRGTGHGPVNRTRTHTQVGYHNAGFE